MCDPIYIPTLNMTIPEGIIAVIGSGGKTSFLRYLASVLPGRVILTTSTHIRPIKDMPLILTRDGDRKENILEQVESSLSESRLICVGTPEYGRDQTTITKLSGPTLPLNDLLVHARYILVEADGSRNRPLKAHRPFEPVIPGGTALIVCIVGASGLGKPISESVHCPDIFCSLTGASLQEPAASASVAAALNKESLADHYVINQADCAENSVELRFLESLIQKPVSVISLKELSEHSVEKR